MSDTTPPTDWAPDTGLTDAERSWGIPRDHGVTVYAEQDVARIKADAYAAGFADRDARAADAAQVRAAVEAVLVRWSGYMRHVRGLVRGKSFVDKMNGREANVWDLAVRELTAALASTAPDAGQREPHPCGHVDRVSGCGGCDPGATESVYDDTEGRWRPFDPARDLAGQRDAQERAEHSPFTDDGVTYCGLDGYGGCGELGPCSTVRADREVEMT